MKTRDKLNLYLRKTLTDNHASNASRFFAFLIDYFCGSIFVSMIPMIITSISTQNKMFGVNQLRSLPLNLQIICCISSFIMAVLYYCIYPLSKRHYAQTLGKRIMNIKVIKTDGSEIMPKDIFIREILGAMIVEGETSFPSAYIRYLLYMLIPLNLATLLGNISIYVSLASAFICFISPSHRMIHDYIAKTRVIKNK